MVSKPSNQRKTINTAGSYVLFVTLLFIFVVTICAASMVLFFSSRNDEQSIITPEIEEVPIDTEPKPPTTPVYKSFDFQPVVDDWVSRAGGNKSVLIYDTKREEIIGSFNPDESYNTASLYKLFVVYKGYENVQNGIWNKDDLIGSAGHSILECLDLAIRESDSLCAESIRSMIGLSNLEDITVNEYGIKNTDINKLISNPRDILTMMKIFYEHTSITDESLISKMQDSFLNQPITTYNWRQGLPSGFNKAKVYNKVGWDYNLDGRYWNIYHDAAIVDFEEDDRQFIVVVMSNRIPFQKIRDFGSQIEKAYLEQSAI